MAQCQVDLTGYCTTCEILAIGNLFQNGGSIILVLALDGCIPQVQPCSFEINIGELGEGRGDPAKAPIPVGVSPKGHNC